MMVSWNVLEDACQICKVLGVTRLGQLTHRWSRIVDSKITWRGLLRVYLQAFHPLKQLQTSQIWVFHTVVLMFTPYYPPLSGQGAPLIQRLSMELKQHSDLEEMFTFSDDFSVTFLLFSSEAMLVMSKCDRMVIPGRVAPKQFRCKDSRNFWLVSTWTTRGLLLFVCLAGLVSRLFCQLFTWYAFLGSRFELKLPVYYLYSCSYSGPFSLDLLAELLDPLFKPCLFLDWYFRLCDFI